MKKLRPGTPVRSTYRAPWYGVIDSITDDGLAVVLRTHDRHGNPFRKRKKDTLHPMWLSPIAELPKETK